MPTSLPKREDLVGRELLADVALGGLQLGGPLDDPLQRGPVDPGRRALGHASPATASAARRRAGAVDIRVERSPAGSAAPGGSSPDRRPGGARGGSLACRKGRKSSIGIGKIVVELFSAAISVTVWR